MENLTEEQKQLLYDLYSLVVHARNTFQRYNYLLMEDIMEGDVRASQMALNNNIFITATKDFLETEKAKMLEDNITERIEKLMSVAEDEEREIN